MQLCGINAAWVIGLRCQYSNRRSSYMLIIIIQFGKKHSSAHHDVFIIMELWGTERETVSAASLHILQGTFFLVIFRNIHTVLVWVTTPGLGSTTIHYRGISVVLTASAVRESNAFNRCLWASRLWAMWKK